MWIKIYNRVNEYWKNVFIKIIYEESNEENKKKRVNTLLFFNYRFLVSRKFSEIYQINKFTLRLIICIKKNQSNMSISKCGIQLSNLLNIRWAYNSYWFNGNFGQYIKQYVWAKNNHWNHYFSLNLINRMDVWLMGSFCTQFSIYDEIKCFII